MKALIASFVVVSLAAIGVALLAWQLSDIPAQRAPLAAPAVPTVPAVEPMIVAALPTNAPPDEAPPRAMLPPTIATLPTRTVPPSPTAPPIERMEAWAAPTALPIRDEEPREGCEPSYPDERTCIPPGPPFDQGCAITEERRFTVLPPDPQGLDHDGDGIGCEPIGSD